MPRKGSRAHDSARKTPRVRTTKAYREERIARCQQYLLRAGTLPDVVKLAKREHFSENTSRWLTALGRLLQSRK